MRNKLIQIVESLTQPTQASAHCDIPCKIYDPSSAIIACLSLIRMVDLIEESKDGEQNAAWLHKISRFVAEKERQGGILKEEIRIIWGDYFKTPQLEKFPEIHELTHSIMLLASKSKQEIDKVASLELLEKVNRFAEIFWETKGVETKRAECPYPPAKKVTYPVL